MATYETQTRKYVDNFSREVHNSHIMQLRMRLREIAMIQEQPRFDETVELSLCDMLTTEEQAQHDAEQLAAVREWLKAGN